MRKLPVRKSYEGSGGERFSRSRFEGRGRRSAVFGIECSTPGVMATGLPLAVTLAAGMSVLLAFQGRAQGVASNSGDGHVCPSPADRKARMAAMFAPSDETQEVLNAIEEVNRALEVPAWAGNYYCGDSLGLNLLLDLSADLFAYRRSGCLGLYDQAHGTVEEQDGELIFTPEAPLRDPSRAPLPTRLVPVTWGERRYLVRPEEMALFLLDVQSGDEPRVYSKGDAFLHRGDHELPALGAPDIPDRYVHLYNASPIEPNVTAVLDRSCTSDGFVERILILAEIDAGASSGIVERMELTTVAPGNATLRARVMEVSEDTSIVRFTRYVFSTGPDPEAGWRLKRVRLGD